jgi:TolA-binding protein
MSDEFRSVSVTVQELAKGISKLDQKLSDLKTIVTTINTPTPPPAANDPNKPPAGVTAEGLFQNAFRDYSGGKEELALAEFADYLKYFPESEKAPDAQYYIGQIYDHGKMYKDAVQAFDAVLKYPPNPRAGDAMYMKGVDLMKDGQKTEAAKALKEFIERFPTHGSVLNARGRLRELGVNPPGARPSQRKKGSQ